MQVQTLLSHFLKQRTIMKWPMIIYIYEEKESTEGKASDMLAKASYSLITLSMYKKDTPLFSHKK